jgi:thiosulfate/3-mercaptopyruvate sulfurtransferase
MIFCSAFRRCYTPLPMSDFYPEHPIVSTDWLAAHLDDPRVRVVDIRGRILPPDQPKPHYFPKAEEYAASHIPGAVFVDWTRDIVNLDDPVPVQIAPPEQFVAFMSSIGVGDGTLVVGYDDHRSALAARLWWALRYYGHDAVRILDGGWNKWVAEGRPVTAEVPQVTPATFTLRLRPAMRKDAQAVAATVASKDALVLDARTPDEYAGRLSRAKRYGHIPGATNLPTLDLVSGPHEQFRSPEELRARFEAAGVSEESTVVTYCNGGVSATLLLAGMELAGLRPPASMYDGSWGEWGNDLDLPIE